MWPGRRFCRRTGVPSRATFPAVPQCLASSLKYDVARPVLLPSRLAGQSLTQPDQRERHGQRSQQGGRHHVAREPLTLLEFAQRSEASAEASYVFSSCGARRCPTTGARASCSRTVNDRHVQSTRTPPQDELQGRLRLGPHAVIHLPLFPHLVLLLLLSHHRIELGLLIGGEHGTHFGHLLRAHFAHA